jgi:ParB family transcriptional regulator, chromosome partitioning protein
MTINHGLGKGLSELLGERRGVDLLDRESILSVDIDNIKAGLYQPRKNFDNESLYELSDSIKRNGLIQPIIVTKTTSGYAIIAGERRWRACRIAGLKQVPVIVKKLHDKEMLEYALVENIQRKDLNVLEEAEGYLRLMGEFGYTQEELSTIIGKSRSHVANILRLNTLPDSIKQNLLSGALSMGHARAIVGHSNAEDIAKIVIDKGLNVRQTENLAKTWHSQSSKGGNRTPYDIESEKNNDLKELVEALSTKFGMKVTIEQLGSGGKVIFHYNTLEQLDDILTKLT